MALSKKQQRELNERMLDGLLAITKHAGAKIHGHTRNALLKHGLIDDDGHITDAGRHFMGEYEMWQWARDVAEWAIASNTMLIYEERALVHEGDVYFLMIEQFPDGEYVYTLGGLADGCREPGVPW